jgi:dihydrodipicolinate synthase/N-acetylneuraminate lyase
MNWKGVFPAVTTPFDSNGEINPTWMKKHLRWLIATGCHGVVPLGSLGEGATLSFDEKQTVLSLSCEAVGTEGVVVAGIAALSTREAVKLAKAAEKIGCHGLMVLPPYAYSSDWFEMKSHVQAVIEATPLPAMLYNNPIAYKTDFLPAQIAELAQECPSLVAVKESSSDVRRIAALKELLEERLSLLVGVDDLIVEGIKAGAVGWIAGLANAFPKESVELFRLASIQGNKDAWNLYRWFLPLLRLDTIVKFVQAIKFVQEEVGAGFALTRPPRLALTEAERGHVKRILKKALSEPVVEHWPFPT